MAALYGVHLKRLREQRGWTQRDLAARVFVSPGRVAQLECASGARPTAELTRALDDALDAGGLLVDLWPHVYRESLPDWSRRFMELSARAVAIRTYAAQAVPGLLQTESYARAVLSVGRTLTSLRMLEERVELRMARQGRLRQPDAPTLRVVVDEAVLARPVGGDRTMREQLEGLHRTCDRYALQVLPFESGAHPMLGGSLTLLTMPDGTEVAYIEGSDQGQLFEDPDDVESFIRAYDQVRADSMPEPMSARMIADAAEGYRHGRSERRALARKQLQQQGGRRLRGGGRRLPRHRPGA
ncbi:helix-turn-helix transcriptional regulator [Streptomyces sp. WMMB303]|uniref:helix-turn-helix domain-containing protein n=1 Tax=Streptomyces sp. WMMB303 TaxID=3034154 RepID=UPI0023EBDA16|nr:helix-turn-helix transcriptional regulator [Streptomyces sp. WMMB303]MDF4250772.1 helix-turn-helix transcriptional regulator [Streptomyces sp. WMMB303]